MPGDSFVPLDFPVHGVDVSTEYNAQLVGTTPVGRNVRAYDAIAQRQRGGSRPGLARYPDALVGSANLIQHLNYIVDPSQDALSTVFDPLDGGAPGIGFGFPFGGTFPPFILPGGTAPNGFLPGEGGFPDPSTNNNADGRGTRNPGRYIRTGGGGISLNRHVGKTKGGIEFVQQTAADGDTLDFVAPVTTGHLLLAGLYGTFSSLPADPVLVDTLGNTWSLVVKGTVFVSVAGFISSPGDLDYFLCAWLFGTVSGFTGVNSVAQTSPVGFFQMGLEYKGTALAPLDSTAKNEQSPETLGVALDATVGPVSVGSLGSLVVNTFTLGTFSGPGWTVGDGSTVRNLESQWLLQDRLNVGSGQTFDAFASCQDNSNHYKFAYVGLAASFRKA